MAIRTRPSKRVRRSSPFAALRDLPRLGPVPKWDEDWSGECADVFESLPSVELPKDHPGRRHFHYGQNDARVLGVELGHDWLKLKFNHYDVERLSCFFIENPWNRFEQIRTLFPVELMFLGVSDLELIRCVEQGVFQKIRCSQRAIDRSAFDICRLECVRYATDRQHYVLQFHGRPGHYLRRPGHETMAHEHNYSLCFSARGLDVSEGYRSGWECLFNGQHLDVLDAFEDVWPVPGWGMPTFENWLQGITNG